MSRTITIYTKPGCHLCDLAKEVIERCRQKIDFAVEVIDISLNPELLERYRNDIPFWTDATASSGCGKWKSVKSILHWR